MTRVISLELNELNVHYVQKYVADGKLPTFRKLFETCALTETVAENAYPYLEPWIQWPTVYTGLSYDQHKIFRLGDGAASPATQIWEYLEARGVKVGAISPMNAGNRCQQPAFFLPDPWTATSAVGEPRVLALFDLIASVVNNNATAAPSFVGTGSKLLPLGLPYLQPGSLPQYARIATKALKYSWAKAALLDRLLADLFLSLIRKHDVGYASLFLNAAAHIQHHHTYDSASYSGDRKNPAWYSKAAADGTDPLLFIYESYDAILADMMALPNTRLFLTTGLSQIPNERDHYQYRPRDYAAFLKKIGLEDAVVEPRMSRDFLLTFADRPATDQAIAQVARATVNGAPLISIEDRGDNLFCQVSCFSPPETLKHVDIGGEIHDFSDDLALVSIENAIHQTKGYHVDTHVPRGAGPVSIPLTDVFDRIATASLGESGVALKQAV